MQYFRPLLAALNEAGARYIVVGGLATILHGYPRITGDIDLIIDLQQDEALKSVSALTALGFFPLAPVPAADFAEKEKRESWRKEKGMLVFSMWQRGEVARVVDLFIENPYPFDEMYARAKIVDLGDALEIRIASIDDLIGMKTGTGRAKDEEDVIRLREIARRER